MQATGLSVRSLFAIAVFVVVLHALALWSLQTSVLPVALGPVPAPERLNARLLTPTATTTVANPAPGSASRGAPLKSPAKGTPAVQTPEAILVPPSAAAPPLDGVTASMGPVPVEQPSAMAHGVAVASPATGIAAASVRVDLPSSSADYLQNPQPAYPPLSRRAGEQGRVVVNVLIGVDGMAQKAHITTSSGFDRLDQAALTTVKSWRYVPGKRGGAPEAMWFSVPIQFVIE